MRHTAPEPQSPLAPASASRARGRVLYVSHILGGWDGVSVEAAKWHTALESLGWDVRRVAPRFGERDRGLPGDTLLPSLKRGVNPDGVLAEMPTLSQAERDQVAGWVRTGDMVVLDNIATLPWSPVATIELVELLESLGARFLIRHHDPSWDHAARPAHPVFPLTPAPSVAVVLHEQMRHDFATKAQIASQVAVNRVDLAALDAGDRRAQRTRLGVGDEAVVLLHAITPYGRKAVMVAAAVADQVARQLAPRPVVYWLTGGQDNPRPGSAYQFIAGRSESIGDMYAAADAVLLPSAWEGWGNSVIEAAVCDLPVVAGQWPALETMRHLGVRPLTIPAAELDAQLQSGANGDTDASGSLGWASAVTAQTLIPQLGKRGLHDVASLRTAVDIRGLRAELASLIDQLYVS